MTLKLPCQPVWRLTKLKQNTIQILTCHNCLSISHFRQFYIHNEIQLFHQLILVRLLVKFPLMLCICHTYHIHSKFKENKLDMSYMKWKNESNSSLFQVWPFSSLFDIVSSTQCIDACTWMEIWSASWDIDVLWHSMH